MNKVLKERQGEDLVLSPEDSHKNKQMPTYILVWSMVSLGKTCMSTSPESLVLSDPLLWKASFCGEPEQSTPRHTAVPRYQQWCQFVLLALLPALPKLHNYQTCTAQDLHAIGLPCKPTHTFPGNEQLRHTPPSRSMLCSHFVEQLMSFYKQRGDSVPSLYSSTFAWPWGPVLTQGTGTK